VSQTFENFVKEHPILEEYHTIFEEGDFKNRVKEDVLLKKFRMTHEGHLGLFSSAYGPLSGCDLVSKYQVG
jgi:hypothetical protein